LNKEFVEYLDVRLKKELKTLQKLPLETEIKIKFASGKGKFDKLRKADRIVKIAIQDEEKSVLVILSRLIGLPVYSELAKNKTYRFLFSDSFIPSKKVELISNNEFSLIVEKVKQYSFNLNNFSIKVFNFMNM